MKRDFRVLESLACISTNLKTNLTFREVNIKLQDSGHNLKFFSFENFRLSDKGELSKDETISYKILLNQLAEKELENFKSGKLHSDDELKELLKKVWMYGDDIDTHTLETHVYALRKKIEKKLNIKDLIMFKEKKGYSLNNKLL